MAVAGSGLVMSFPFPFLTAKFVTHRSFHRFFVESERVFRGLLRFRLSARDAQCERSLASLLNVWCGNLAEVALCSTPYACAVRQSGRSHEGQLSVCVCACVCACVCVCLCVCAFLSF